MREARFVDLVNESLDGYSDAQIGAAARDVLRDSKKVLDRLFRSNLWPRPKKANRSKCRRATMPDVIG